MSTVLSIDSPLLNPWLRCETRLSNCNAAEWLALSCRLASQAGQAVDGGQDVQLAVPVTEAALVMLDHVAADRYMTCSAYLLVACKLVLTCHNAACLYCHFCDQSFCNFFHIVDGHMKQRLLLICLVLRRSSLYMCKSACWLSFSLGDAGTLLSDNHPAQHRAMLPAENQLCK